MPLRELRVGKWGFFPIAHTAAAPILPAMTDEEARLVAIVNEDRRLIAQLQAEVERLKELLTIYAIRYGAIIPEALRTPSRSEKDRPPPPSA